MLYIWQVDAIRIGWWPYELVFSIVCWTLQHGHVLHEVLFNSGHGPLLEAPIGLLVELTCSCVPMARRILIS